MIKNLYYKLTKYIPRKVPKTKEEFDEMKKIFTAYYGLEDHPKYWYTVATQLVAGDPTSLRRSYGKMVNAAHKLNIAALAQELKGLASEEFKVRLEEKAKEVSHAFQKEEAEREAIKPQWSDVPGQPHPPENPAVLPIGAQPVQAELQVVQAPSEGVVPAPTTEWL